MRYAKPHLLLILAALAFAGCGTTADPSDDGADMTMSMPDGGGESDDDDAADPETGFWEIGTNPLQMGNPENFTVVQPGSQVPLVWGVQGSWMVILAFRERDMFAETFDVRAEMSIDGVDSGNIWLEQQESFPGGDGWNYYYNLFLALSIDEPAAQGTPAEITMRVTDAEGRDESQTVKVQIGEQVGGP